MRTFARRASLVAALIGFWSHPATAVAAQIPARMIGTWANGSCSVPANRLVVTPISVKIGAAKPAAAHFEADDGSPNGAIHWNQEYVVDNFEYVNGPNIIVHNLQGFHMPGRVAYKRCPS